MILCKNVAFQFNDEKELLRNVSFNIPSGSITYLLGLNGCGKTTLLNCIGGNYKDYKGLIKTDPNCRFITTLPEICNDLTGMEYIEMLTSLRNKLDESDVYEMIESLGVRKLLEKPIKNCAVYMRNLLMIFTSLCTNSEVIILDEPLRNMDHQSRKNLIHMIKKLKEQGKTVLIATNIIYSAFDVADDLIVLHRGKTKQFKNLFKDIKHYENKIMPLIMS